MGEDLYLIGCSTDGTTDKIYTCEVFPPMGKTYNPRTTRQGQRFKVGTPVMLMFGS